MCGIVGYIGPKEVIPILIGGLERLEYRGYDSAGVATINDADTFNVFRAEGKLEKLKALLSKDSPKNGSNGNGNHAAFHIGIGHTRWATHGRPTETNAHPHVAGKVCVVHNGIIENYVELRQMLEGEGCEFQSETDTEIAAHLINYNLRSCSTLFDAFRKSVSELEGSYALVVMSTASSQELLVAKNATPVLIGLSEQGAFIASDIPAILDHTRQVYVLEDGDLARVSKDSVEIFRDGQQVPRSPITVTWDPITAKKSGYAHFMLKEIHEQPQVITDTFRGRIDLERNDIVLDGLNFSDDELRQVRRISLVACGTAWHACLITKFYLERFCRLPVEVDYGSEFRYREPVIDGETLFVVVSQSGETADTLGSLKLASSIGAKTLAICNVVGSSISRQAKGIVYTHAGPEISVASTKAFVTQVTAGFLLALKIGIVRGTVSTSQVAEALDELCNLPGAVSQALRTEKQIQKIAKKYGKSEDFLFLGRGILYPVALEGALKLKEISYVHAEGYPAGEMKHGPIALINEETPVVVLLGRDGVNYEKAVSNLKEVEARGGRIIAVTDVATKEVSDAAWELIEVGETPQPMLPIVMTVPLQLLAYYVAVYRGTDVDQPRNLAKSVTVE